MGLNVVWYPTFFKISSFKFYRRKNPYRFKTWVCPNVDRMLIFLMNYASDMPFILLRHQKHYLLLTSTSKTVHSIKLLNKVTNPLYFGRSNMDRLCHMPPSSIHIIWDLWWGQTNYNALLCISNLKTKIVGPMHYMLILIIQSLALKAISV